jgi:predicted aspartyl protease
MSGNGDEWVTISDQVTPEDLQRDGITLHLAIAPMTDLKQQHNVLAEIDTGATHTAISLELANALRESGIVPSGYGHQRHAQEARPRISEFFRCLVIFPGGTLVETDATVLPRSIKPHDVLIGRDILKRCRLTVDYSTGEWSLSFGPDTTRHDDNAPPIA